MTTDELRAAAGELAALHARFAPRFGRAEARVQSLTYLHGLLLAPGRKSAEPMALVFGEQVEAPARHLPVLALQRFLTVSPWASSDVQRDLQAAFADKLVPSAQGSRVGVVAALDPSAFVKKGTESVGVQRQYCGRLGKKENCQVGVFLVGVTPAGTALLDHQLYLPKKWIQDRDRRKKTRVPPKQKFRTKQQIGLELLRRTRANGLVTPDWLTADEEFGRNGAFLNELEEMQQRYLVQVPVNTTVWTLDPHAPVPWGERGPRRQQALRSVKQIADHLPAEAWQTFQVREGAVGPLVFQFARLRVWTVRRRKSGPPAWLVIRKSLEPTPEVKYYLSNAAPEVDLETLALVTGTHWHVEEFLEECKSYLGMAHYEARSWTSWHHHMSLVGLAHWFVTLTRQRLKKNSGDHLGHGCASAHQCPAAA